MKKAQLIAAAAAPFLLLLGGCSAAVTSSHTSKSTVTPTPEPEGDGTVSQWASIVAEQKASLEGWKAKWDADQCSVSSSLICSVETLTGTYVVKTSSISLASPETTTATNYIGTPPSEIRSLYEDTRTAADSAQAAGDQWSANCGAGKPASEECDSLLFAFSRAIDTLELKFEAWSPYL